MDEKVDKAWEAYLDPKTMRRRMVGTAVLITTFEVLKDAVLSRPREFFSEDWDADGNPIPSPRYRSEVKALHPDSITLASLTWWQLAGAIDEADIKAFKAVRNVRNVLAHELGAALGRPELDDIAGVFTTMMGLLAKLERWWVVQIEIPANPSYDGEEINEQEVMPGKVIYGQLLHKLAFAPEEELAAILAEVKAHSAWPRDP